LHFLIYISLAKTGLQKDQDRYATAERRKTQIDRLQLSACPLRIHCATVIMEQALGKLSTVQISEPHAFVAPGTGGVGRHALLGICME
jgi:hypothetical protein